MNLKITRQTAISSGIVLAFPIITAMVLLFVIPSVSYSDDIYFLKQRTTASNFTDTTECYNVGNGVLVVRDFTGGNCNFKTLVGSPDISITNTTNTIIIDFNGTTGGSETTQCINIGSGTLIIKNSTSGNCFVKSIAVGTGLSISNDSNTIIISANTQTSNLMQTNVHTDTITNSAGDGDIIAGNGTKWGNIFGNNSGEGQFLRVRSIPNLPDLEYSYQKVVITSSASYSPTANDDAVYVNATTGNKIVNIPAFDSFLSGKIFYIKKIDSSSNTVTISINGLGGIGSGKIDGSSSYLLTRQHQAVIIQVKALDDVRILSSYTICNNLGSVGEGIYVSGNCDFKKLLGGTGITLSSNGTRITITNSLPEQGCSSAGGTTLLKTASTCNFKGLTAGVGLSLTSNTNDNNYKTNFANGTGISITGSGQQTFANSGVISNSCSGPITCSGTNPSSIACSTCITSIPLIGQIVTDVFVSKTMTNIGTTNVDIYTTAFDQEDMAIIDCTSITDFRVVWMWDYVGAGTQTVRWVDASNNANVLYTTTTLVDADALDSGWFTKPAWCSGIKTIEEQGSSTTATDDPVAKGYLIFAR